MLLILSRRTDDHVRFLLPYLEARGARHRWIDLGDFPGRATISLGNEAGGRVRRRLHYDGGPVELDDVAAVWYRRPTDATAAAGLAAPDYGRCAVAVGTTVLDGLVEGIDARWVPARPAVAIAAQNKVTQLALAPRLGFTLPRTLITNDPDDVLPFWEACEGRMVAKLVSMVGPIQAPDGVRRMATYVVRRRDLANFRSLRHAPMILQEYVPKRLELRVTVVGRTVFACGIDSQASRVTRHDWRHYDHDRAAFAPHDLPDDVAARCVRIVEASGLCYGAIDLVLTPAGEYVFLELNPTGEWLFVQLHAGLPIADAVADLLTAPPAAAAISLGGPPRGEARGALPA